MFMLSHIGFASQLEIEVPACNWLSSFQLWWENKKQNFLTLKQCRQKIWSLILKKKRKKKV